MASSFEAGVINPCFGVVIMVVPWEFIENSYSLAMAIIVAATDSTFI